MPPEENTVVVGELFERIVRSPSIPSTLRVDDRSVECVIATDTEEIYGYHYDIGRAKEIIIISGIELPESGKVPHLNCHKKYDIADQLGSVRDFKTIEENGIKKLIGRKYYGRSQLASDAFALDQDGHGTDNSVGLTPKEILLLKEDESREIDGKVYAGPAIIITRSRIDESSTCPIGADKHAMNRNQKGNIMPPEENNTNTPSTPETPPAGGQGQGGETTPVQRTQPMAPPVQSGLSSEDVNTRIQTAVAAERSRSVAILDLQTQYDLSDEWVSTMTRSGNTIDQITRAAADAVLERSRQNPTPAVPNGGVHFYNTVESKELFRTAMQDGIMVRCGTLADSTEAPLAEGFQRFANRTQVEIARAFLDAHNLPSDGHADEIITRAIATSDYAVVFGNIANKSVLIGFNEQEETYQQWIDNTGTVNDFKKHTLARLGEFDNLDEVKELEEYEYGNTSEQKEEYQIATYGKLMCISRQALVNDDLNEISASPRNMGRAAQRKLGDIAYGVLIGNPNMGDGIPLFDAAHNNLATNVGGVNTARYTQADVAMGTQKDIHNKAFINVDPKFFVSSRAHRAQAEEFFRTRNFSDGNEASTRVNVHFDAVSRIYESRLDAEYGSDLAWFLLGDRAFNVKMYYLFGRKTPFIERQDMFKVDGMTWKVRMDAVAKALHWRTMFFNPGV